MCGVLFSKTQGDSTPRCLDLSTTRIMLLGDPQTGKTSLTRRFIKGVYLDADSNDHIEDIYHRKVNLRTLLKKYQDSNNDPAFKRIWDSCNGLTHKVDPTHPKKCDARRYASMDIQVLDSSSSDLTDFSDLRDGQISQADAFVLSFDPTNRESLYNVRNYQRQIEQVRGIDDAVPILVVGTKCDLVADEGVSKREIRDFLEACDLSYERDYIEISSRDNINVDELFIKVLLRSEDYKYQGRLALRGSQEEDNTNSTLNKETVPSITTTKITAGPVTKVVSNPPSLSMSSSESWRGLASMDQCGPNCIQSNGRWERHSPVYGSKKSEKLTQLARSESQCVAEVLHKNRTEAYSSVVSIPSEASRTPVSLRSHTSSIVSRSSDRKTRTVRHDQSSCIIS